jgi:hypothetical protein
MDLKRKQIRETQAYESVSRLKWAKTVVDPNNYLEEESDLNFELAGNAHDNNPEGYRRLDDILAILRGFFGPFELKDLDIAQEFLSVETLADELGGSNKMSAAVAAVRAEFPIAFLHPIRFEKIREQEYDEVAEAEPEFDFETDIYAWCDVNEAEAKEYVHGSPARA